MHEAPWRPSCVQSEQFHIQKGSKLPNPSKLQAKDAQGPLGRKLLRNQQSGEDGGAQKWGLRSTGTPSAKSFAWSQKWERCSPC